MKKINFFKKLFAGILAAFAVITIIPCSASAASVDLTQYSIDTVLEGRKRVDNTTKFVKYIKITNGNLVDVRDNKIVSLQPNKKYTVALAVHDSKGEFDVYLNQEKVITSTKFVEDFPNDYTQFRVLNLTQMKKTDGTSNNVNHDYPDFYMDDVKLYYASKPESAGGIPGETAPGGGNGTKTYLVNQNFDSYSVGTSSNISNVSTCVVAVKNNGHVSGQISVQNQDNTVIGASNSTNKAIKYDKQYHDAPDGTALCGHYTDIKASTEVSVVDGRDFVLEFTFWYGENNTSAGNNNNTGNNTPGNTSTSTPPNSGEDATISNKVILKPMNIGKKEDFEFTAVTPDNSGSSKSEKLFNETTKDKLCIASVSGGTLLVFAVSYLMGKKIM